MAYTSNFSGWLTTELEERNMSQSELARQAGVTRAAINGVLTGSRNPGNDLCIGIADAFGLPPETVYRKAGLLPPTTEAEEDERLLNYLYNNLKTPAAKKQAREYIKFVSAQEEQGVYTEDAQDSPPKKK